MMMFYKLVVLGDAGVGKTALAIKFCVNNVFDIYESYRKQIGIDNHQCLLEILDTMEQEEYFREADGFLLVYSVASRSTFEYVKRIRSLIFKVSGTDSAPIMLVGNKCDKENDREVTREEGASLAKQFACNFVETSAKTDLNVERSFCEIVRAIRSQREGLKPGAAKGTSLKKRKKSKKCLIL